MMIEAQAEELAEDLLAEDQTLDPVTMPRARNPRLVGPDDFQWWLMLEQLETM